MKKTLIIIAMQITASTISIAQDGMFSQYKSASLYYNPAVIGSSNKSRMSLVHRNQWPGIDSKMTNTYVGLDHTFNTSTVGLYYTQENRWEGRSSTNQLAFVYSKRFSINENINIVGGVKGSFLSKKLENSYSAIYLVGLDSSNGYIYNPDNTMPDLTIVKGTLDFGLGFLMTIKKFNLGFSLDHITQPDMNIVSPISPLYRKYVFQTGYNFLLASEKLILTPSLLMTVQHNTSSMLISSSIRYKQGILGIGYRNQDALVFLVGIQKQKFSLLYSFDYTISKLGYSTTKGSHEVSLNIMIDWNKEKAEGK